eukprot:351107-Chlamydomonas_euryale.AAC.1
MNHSLRQPTAVPAACGKAATERGGGARRGAAPAAAGRTGQRPQASRGAAPAAADGLSLCVCGGAPVGWGGGSRAVPSTCTARVAGQPHPMRVEVRAPKAVHTPFGSLAIDECSLVRVQPSVRPIALSTACRIQYIL